jgi:multicomponent K+:H+ antiporter subunit F
MRLFRPKWLETRMGQAESPFGCSTGGSVMLSTVVPIAIGAFAFALLLNLLRLLKGPSLPDRVLALDTLYVNSVALLLLIGIQFKTMLFFEAALVIALLGFVGTVCVSKYISRGDIVE